MSYLRHIARRSPIMLGPEAPIEFVTGQDGFRPYIQSRPEPSRRDLEEPCITVTDNFFRQDRAEDAFEVQPNIHPLREADSRRVQRCGFAVGGAELGRRNPPAAPYVLNRH